MTAAPHPHGQGAAYDKGRFNQLRSLVQFPEGYEPAVLVPLGYVADETAPRARKDMSEVWE